MGRLIHLKVPVLLVLLALAGCASAPPVPQGASVQGTLQAAAHTHHVCGVAVAVIRQRQVDSVEAASGCPGAAVPGPDTVFQAASLSKPLFAYAVMKLAAAGKLSLDAPVMSYLPQGYRHQFELMKAEPSAMVTDPRLQAVTVRMLLNHTGGLPNWAGGPLKFGSEPGAKWEYSGEGYLLLQRAVEAVTGQPLDVFMASSVFEPLGMRHSAFRWSEAVEARLLPGTKADGSPRQTFRLDQPVAAFSLYTTAADYARFCSALLNDRALLAQTSAKAAQVDPSLGLEWGLGWGLERAGSDTALWQWGNNPGYRAFVMVSQETGDGFVMLTNSENGLKLAVPLAERILPREHNAFRSSIMGTDLASLVCNAIRVCL